MRVLLVAGMYPPKMCGVGDYTLRLAESLAERKGLSVGLLNNQEFGTELQNIQNVRFNGVWEFRALPEIWRALRGFAPDIVHIQHPSLGYRRSLSPILLALLVRMAGIRLVVTLHESLRWRSAGRFFGLVLSAFSVVFVRHNFLDLLPKTYARILQRKPHALIVNASAVPTSELPTESRARLRETYLNGKQRLLCYFGFIFPNKGLELLLDVIEPQTDRLILLGANPDLQYNERLAQLIAEKRLMGSVMMTGALPATEVADCLAVADAVILPLPNGVGSWNTTLHSALAQGTTLIATTLGMPQHDLKRNLFLVKPGDTRAMEHLLAQYAGRKVTPEPTRVQWNRIVGEHLQVYFESLKSDG